VAKGLIVTIKEWIVSMQFSLKLLVKKELLVRKEREKKKMGTENVRPEGPLVEEIMSW
jgi:hypothetical protein